MASYSACKDQLVRLLKARVPFISFKTDERSRAVQMLKEICDEMQMPVYLHTLTGGVKELLQGKKVSEDGSVAGALGFAVQQFTQRTNLTVSFTDLNGVSDDNELSRQLYDLSLLAGERGGCVILIGTLAIWPNLQRLGMSVELSRPDEDEMAKIIEEFLKPYKGDLEIEWGADEMKRAGALLSNLSRLEAENILSTYLARGALKKADIEEIALSKDALFSNVAGIERVAIRKGELTVGGLTGLTQWLDRERSLLNRDLRDRGIRPPRGVLLVGVPGCGKSLSAKAVAASWNLPLYRLDLATIHGMYLGQSENRLKESLASADHVAPCVLWIDEIEKGLAGSGGNDGGASTRLVGHFLYWLQESRAKVFVVATANDISKLPPELFRKGRFDEIFFVDLPSVKERASIIEIYLGRYLQQKVGPADLAKLVELSADFSGADLEAAIRDVAKKAIIDGDDKVSVDDLFASFKNIVPFARTNPEELERIREWGRQRALPASGQEIGAPSSAPMVRRILAS